MFLVSRGCGRRILLRIFSKALLHNLANIALLKECAGTKPLAASYKHPTPPNGVNQKLQPHFNPPPQVAMLFL
jgi:hypothetical protein